MMETEAVDLRPRTSGEILDDAWRLALAEAPPLLFFSTLFLVPAFAVVLLLLATPIPAHAGQAVLPALAALLLPLTGLGSGACQDLLRRRAEGKPLAVGLCLLSAVRHGLHHIAARAVVLSAIACGLVVLVMPGLTVWIASTPIHALIGSERDRTGGLWHELGQEAAFDPTKAAIVTLARLPLLLVAALNLHLLAGILLWTAENLAGFDTALFGVTITFFSNPLYTVGLFMLCWILLAPFFEAANFLLHLDTRIRREGLDLFFRVQRVFGAGNTTAVVRVGALLLGLAGLVSHCGATRADDPPAGDHPTLPSPARVKSLLRPRQHPTPAAHPAQEQAEQRKPAAEADDPAPGTRTGRRRGRDAPLSVPVLDLTPFWIVLASLALAVLGVAFYLFWTSRTRWRPKPLGRQALPPGEPDLPGPGEKTPAELWRQAIALAAAGQHRAALRLLYRAVLFTLNRQHLVQYEATRTNGEYLRQLRQAENASPGLYAPFEQLTALLEVRWYGEGSCGAEDFEAGQRLAEAVRDCAGPA
jgi:hypothetical protein